MWRSLAHIVLHSLYNNNNNNNNLIRIIYNISHNSMMCVHRGSRRVIKRRRVKQKTKLHSDAELLNFVNPGSGMIVGPETIH